MRAMNGTLRGAGPALAGLAMVVATTVMGPAQANTHRLDRAATVALASDSASIWHAPHRGFIVQDRNQMSTQTLPARPEAMAACQGDLTCKAMVLGYYHHMAHQWRVLNRSLWELVDGLPRCADFASDCTTREDGVHLRQRWFVANQRAVFS